MENNLIKGLHVGPVLPALRTVEDFKVAMTSNISPSVVLLFGDINILPELLAQAKQSQKRILLHLDLFEGIGKDKAGIKYLARMGITAIITTKTHLAKLARAEGMIVIQRLFIMDSESIKTAINMVRSFKPDAIEILPASVPGWVVESLNRELGLPILAGGLIHDSTEVQETLQKGVAVVTTNRRELWNMKL
ncbi:MAG TPA: glycerol-3-phosphate responsive antiterminator [Negativicutes bacterium]